VTERDFSISTSLDASTVTPGSTAPEVSRTTPAMMLCADATDAPIAVNASTSRTLTQRLPLNTLIGVPPCEVGVQTREQPRSNRPFGQRKSGELLYRFD